jgi:hypothetical protein
MGRIWEKGKGLIITVLLVALLYFSSYSLRFWPVILLDMFLRLPGDILLKLVQPPVSSTAFEILRRLFQLGTALLVWGILIKLGLVYSEANAQPKPEKETLGGTKKPSQSHTLQAKHQTNLKAWIIILFILIILNSRGGFGIAGIVNLVTGVIPYSLQPETLFTVENPGKEKELPARPALFFLFEDEKDFDKQTNRARPVWEAITTSGLWSLKFDYGREPEPGAMSRDFKSFWDKMDKYMDKYEGGYERQAISSNIDTFINGTESGWKKEFEAGYLIYIGSLSPGKIAFEGYKAIFPSVLMAADNLEKACQFLQELTGVIITIEKNAISGRLQDQIRKEFIFEHRGNSTLLELVENIAIVYQLKAEFKEGVINLRPLREEEIEPRVKELMNELPSVRSEWYSSQEKPTFFPEGGAESIINFLESLNSEEVKDPSVIGRALEALWLTDIRPVQDKLDQMLVNGQTASGCKLSASEIEKLAGLLVRSGDRAALEFYMKNYKLKRQTIWDWYSLDMATEPGSEAVEIQNFLFKKFRNPCPLVRSSFADRIRFGCYQEGLDFLEFWQAEKLALDFLNNFCDWTWDERAEATLTVSPDGQQVSYDLEMFYYRGPLAAGGSSYSVHLIKARGGWLIKRVSAGPNWIS